ncbi:MAG: NAD(P)H-hydrate dehydratase [Ignavibacteriae bacterium]|nr:NAD(P)H-hydrate dehydratase [Ignavibacteriota bacterium]
MERAVTSDEMRSFDGYAINRLNIPSLLLMENAGKGVVQKMNEQFGDLSVKLVYILCGKGNNGGDGFVVARHLLIHGSKVEVILTCKPNELKGDPLTNFNILKSLLSKSSESTESRKSRESHKSRSGVVQFSSLKKMKMLQPPDIIVDALFGTGFKGELNGKYKSLVEWANELPAKRVSIDIPSGVNADNGVAEGVAFKADITVTMALKKIGLTLNQGRSYGGHLEVVDIGVPTDLPIVGKFQTYIIEQKDVQATLPVRSFNVHKHSVGKILVLAGSVGLTGAAAMVSESAMKVGAGAVVLGTPKSVYSILAKKLTEVMTEPLDSTDEGSLSQSSLPEIEKLLQWADMLVLGPGLSRNQETQQLIQHLVSTSTKPMLIDADGLNAIAENPSCLKKRKTKEVILTPHTGELSRIIKLSSEEIEKNRIEIARRVAKEFKVTLVLKGAPTVTATHEGKVFINSTGNPGMATAGSGDVLAGLIAGLWGQGMTSDEAAWCGVFLHGKAGDLAKVKYGEKSLLATDIKTFVPEAIRHVELGLH